MLLMGTLLSVISVICCIKILKGIGSKVMQNFIGGEQQQLAGSNYSANQAQTLKKEFAENPDVKNAKKSPNKAAQIASNLMSNVANTKLGRGARIAGGLVMAGASPGLIVGELAVKGAAKVGGAAGRKIGGVAKIGVSKVYKAVKNSEQLKKVKNAASDVAFTAGLFGEMVGKEAKRRINGARTTVLNSKAYKAAQKGANWAGERVNDARKVANIVGDKLELAKVAAGVYGLEAMDEIKSTAGYRIGAHGVRKVKEAVTASSLRYNGLHAPRGSAEKYQQRNERNRERQGTAPIGITVNEINLSQQQNPQLHEHNYGVNTTIGLHNVWLNPDNKGLNRKQKFTLYRLNEAQASSGFMTSNNSNYESGENYQNLFREVAKLPELDNETRKIIAINADKLSQERKRQQELIARRKVDRTI